MIKGAISKQNITKKILETFSGSFLYDKEIRIPVEENGELIQLKCTLTCAKTNVNQGDNELIPGEINFEDTNTIVNTSNNTENKTEITQEEKDRIKNLMDVFGL